LEPRHQGLIKQAIDKYVVWLNEATADCREPYTLEEVVPIQVNLLIEDEDTDDTIVHVYVGPDEGGGYAVLQIQASREFEFNPTGKTIHDPNYQTHEITGYNTEPDGTNTVVKLDPPKESPISYPETKMEYKDTYELELVVQYFDSSYTIIYNATDTRFSNINKA
jgi:hypothetical protein